MFNRVVVGVDGGDGGRDAIALAKNLLARGGELTLACIYAGDAHIYRGASAEYTAAERERARELLEKERSQAQVAARLRGRAASSPGRGLHELCELIDPDLLVVGSSRRGLVGRVLIGDDTRGALNGAPCAIAIAPRAIRRNRLRCGRSGSAMTAHPKATTRSRSQDGSQPRVEPSYPHSRPCRCPHTPSWAGRLQSTVSSSRWSMRRVTASLPSGTLSRTPPTAGPSRSSPCTARRSTCSSWDPVATDRSDD